jgi:RNA polymerase sigma-70 factor (ECF subfamily)
MLTDDQRRIFEAWIAAVGPRAIAYARSLLRDRSRAEDVVQECLYRLLRNAAAYDLERDGTKILFKAISNLCINQTSREKQLLPLDGGSDPDHGPLTLADSNALRPEQIAQSRELEEQVRAALQGLPELQRAAVELRALGLSKEEIADTLGVSVSNAGVLVHRGRHALARVLGTRFGSTDSEEKM